MLVLLGAVHIIRLLSVHPSLQILIISFFLTKCSDEDLSLGQAMAGMLGVTPYAGGGGSYTEWAAKMASLDPIKYPGLSDVTSVFLLRPIFLNLSTY